MSRCPKSLFDSSFPLRRAKNSVGFVLRWTPLVRASAVFFLLSVLMPGVSRAALDPCGGEGPTPINDEKVTPKYHSVMAVGSVLEYAVSESTNEVFYRTDSKEIYRTPFGATKSTKVTDSPYALSKVMHKKGDYLVADPEMYLWKLGSSTSWASTTRLTDPVQPMFWDSDRLYAYVEERDLAGIPSFQFLKYEAGRGYASRQCGHIAANHWGFTMAGGGAFPYVYFYSTSPVCGGTQLSVYRYDLRTCGMSTLVTYRTPLPGSVKWVHYFQGSNTLAVATDHPTKNVLFDQGRGICQYYDFGGDEVVVANPRVPSVVVLRNDSHADVVYLLTGKKNQLVSAGNYYSNVRWSDFHLTSDGKNLFVAPETGGARELIQVKIKP